MSVRGILFVVGVVLCYARSTFGNEKPAFDNETTSVVVGIYMKTTVIQCTVHNIGSKSVAFIRHEDEQLLSVGTFIYTSDQRFQVSTEIGRDGKQDYILRIKNTQLNDTGLYKCVILAEPKLSHSIRVVVEEDNSVVKFCEENVSVMCSDFKCIEFKQLCNGISDCSNYWDEMFCIGGYGKRACRLWGCNDTCIAPEDGVKQYWFNRKVPKCSCNKSGFILDEDGKSCLNINECLKENGGCSHSCTNTPGSFYCSCFEGYTLSKDGHSCQTNNTDPVLFYSTSHSVNIFKIRFRRHFALLNSLSYILGIAFHQNDSRVFWAEKDMYSAQGNISSSILASLPRNDDHYKFSPGTDCPEDVIVDHLTSLIYVADMCSSQISVFSVNETEGKLYNQISTIINQFILQPVSIALDPHNRTIFWADWGLDLGIQRSTTDGLDAEVLVKTSIMKPKALVYDETSKKLFWTDFELGVIESVNADGKKRKIILESHSGFKPYALAVFEDRIYFSNWTGSSVMSCKKIQCDQTSTELLFSADDVITDLYV